MTRALQITMTLAVAWLVVRTGPAIAQNLDAIFTVERMDELCGPYASVIDIDKSKLPTPAKVKAWSGDQFAKALRHDQKCRDYNSHFRQLLHVGFKVAAGLGDRYIEALRQNEGIVAKNVSENVFDRHLRPVFIGK